MPGIKASIGADASQMASEFKRAERLSQVAGNNIQKNIQGGNGTHANSGAIRETMVLLREMGRGNWSRVPGSLSILVGQVGLLEKIFKDNSVAARVFAQGMEKSAAAATAKALASKAVYEADLLALATMRTVSTETILAVAADREKVAADLLVADAERVKAVAARNAAAAMEAEGVATRFSLGPLGWALIAVVALGAGIYALASHYRKVAAEAKNLADLMDTTHAKFSEQAEILKQSAEEAQGFNDWLRKLANSEETLTEKVQDGLKALRERAKYERELAVEKHKSQKDLAAMDIAEAQKELDFVVKAKLEAKRKLEQDTIGATDAEKAANNPDRAGQIKNLGEHSKEAGQIVDAIQEAMKTKIISEIKPGSGFGQLGGTPESYTRPANSTDKIDVKVGGKEFSMSLAEAKEAFDKIAAEEARLAAIQKELGDILEQKKKLTEKDLADVQRLTREAGDIQADLDLKKEFLPQIAAGKDKTAHGSVSSLQQIGAYASPASEGISVARSSLRVLHTIAGHTSKIGSGNGGATGGTKF